MAITIWAWSAAEHVMKEFWNVPANAMLESKQERIATIIEGCAEPLIALLHEARREHHTHDKGWYCGIFYDLACDCGASEWNQKIDDALKQEVR